MMQLPKIILVSLICLKIPLFSGNLPRRIITMAPALTEIVFKLGKGGQLVANTRYCDFPKAAKTIPHIGGYIDLNKEHLINFKADLIIHYPEHRDMIQFLVGQTQTLEVAHTRLSDIITAIQKIADSLGISERGRQETATINRDLERIARSSRGKPPRKCLFILGRNRSDLRNMIIMGKSDFINDILTICGGINVYHGSIPHPSVSLESISQLSPDFIFEISSAYEGIPPEEIIVLWKPYNWIPAVTKSQIHIISNSAWLRPGPRIVEMARELVGILHHD